MTVTTNTNRSSTVADGIVTVFNYTFDLADDGDMNVYIGNTGYPSNDPTYGWTLDSTAKTVTFITAPPDGELVTLIRLVDATQLTDYRPYDAFPAETHEAALDKLTMLVQQATELGSRSIHFPLDEDNSGLLPPVADRVDKFLSFDSNGDILMSTGTQTSPTTVQQSGNITPGNVMEWENQQLAKDSGIPVAGLYGTHNPPPDIYGAGNKIDKISPVTAGNAVVTDSNGELTDAGFSLIGMEVGTYEVTNWARGGHSPKAHGLSSRPVFITIEAETLTTIGGWAAGSRINIGHQAYVREGDDNRAILAVWCDSTTFQVAHSSVDSDNYLMIPRQPTGAESNAEPVYVNESEVKLWITLVGFSS